MPFVADTVPFLAVLQEGEGLGGKEELEELLKDEMVGRSVIDTVVQMSAKHVQIMKAEMVSFALHIIMELAGGMSGQGRRKLIKNGVVDIIMQVRPHGKAGLHSCALKAAPLFGVRQNYTFFCGSAGAPFGQPGQHSHRRAAGKAPLTLTLSLPSLDLVTAFP